VESRTAEACAVIGLRRLRLTRKVGTSSTSLSHSGHAPRPGVLVVEGRLSKSTIMELERRGHKIELGPDWSKAASLPGPAAANARGMQGYAIGR
jgi:hypothetical protein